MSYKQFGQALLHYANDKKRVEYFHVEMTPCCVRRSTDAWVIIELLCTAIETD